MIKNSVLTFILRLRAKNYVRAFWYKMREMVRKHMLINSISHFNHFDILTRNYARYARTKPFILTHLI